MAAEAREVREFGLERVKVAAATGAREVIQLPSGRAGLFDDDAGLAQDVYGNFVTTGVYGIKKATGWVALPGLPVFWDHSANNATYKKVNDRDFPIGVIVKDAESSETLVEVDLNVEPRWDIDIARDPVIHTPVGTQGLNTMGVFRRGGSHLFLISSTSEAQKLDLISRDGFATGANAIVRFAFNVISDGAGSAPDISLGIANGTDATNADSITESVFIHLDGNSTTIYAESDDGSTEVNATDTTLTYTEGSAIAQRVEVWMDMRNPADVQIYVNGVLVLGATVFAVNAATGPWFLLAHIEKTSAADVYQLSLEWMQAHFSEQ